jgi:arylsulfatase A-like enzyme
MSDAEIHRARAGYYGEISFIDSQIGRLLCWMNNRSEAMANTWIVFASDHGDMLGDHNLWRKTYAYEGSARIPMLIVPPKESGPPARAVAGEVAELRDIMPSLLELVGVPTPSTVDGTSLVPLMSKPPAAWRPYIHGEHCACYHTDQEMQYVTDGFHKFIWLPRRGEEQFFDLERDPGELNNRIADPDYQPAIAKWRAFLVSELAKRDCGWVVDGSLHCPDDKPLISPFRDVRWSGGR